MIDRDGYETQSLLSVPLTDQKGEIVGLLQLVNARSADGSISGFDPTSKRSCGGVPLSGRHSC